MSAHEGSDNDDTGSETVVVQGSFEERLRIASLQRAEVLAAKAAAKTAQSSDLDANPTVRKYYVKQSKQSGKSPAAQQAQTPRQQEDVTQFVEPEAEMAAESQAVSHQHEVFKTLRRKSSFSKIAAVFVLGMTIGYGLGVMTGFWVL